MYHDDLMGAEKTKVTNWKGIERSLFTLRVPALNHSFNYSYDDKNPSKQSKAKDCVGPSSKMFICLHMAKYLDIPWNMQWNVI